MVTPCPFWVICRSGQSELALRDYDQVPAAEVRSIFHGISTLIALVKSRVQDALALRLVDLLWDHAVCRHDAAGKTVFEYAVEVGSAQIVQHLVRRVDNESKTRAFVLAVYSKDFGMAEKLIAYGANVNAYFQHGLNAMHMSICYNNDTLLKLLLKKGADAELPTSSMGYSCLLLAVSRNRPISTVHMLLENGSNVHCVSRMSGMNVVLMAVEVGNREMVKLLLQYGADVHCVCFKRMNALHYACRNHDVAMVSDLLAYGVNLNWKNRHGLTPFDIGIGMHAQMNAAFVQFMHGRGATFKLAPYLARYCESEESGWGKIDFRHDLLTLLRLAPAPLQSWLPNLNNRLKKEWRSWCADVRADSCAFQVFKRAALPDVLITSIKAYLMENECILRAVQETMEEANIN